MIDERGYDDATVTAIRTRAGVSNGSFFHFFDSKERLAAELFLETIRTYHGAMLRAVRNDIGAKDGVAALIRTHIFWGTTNRSEARFLFEQVRAEWFEGITDALRTENLMYGENLDRWRLPLIEKGDLLPVSARVFASQVIGPAQMFCRAWLSGRDHTDPGKYAQEIIDCAIRAVVAAGTKEKRKRQ